MSFQIDTGAQEPQITPRSRSIEATQGVDLTDYVRADREQRKIITNIEAHENAARLDAYIVAEDLMIDALYMTHSEMADEIHDIYQTRRACIDIPAPHNSLGISF